MASRAGRVGEGVTARRLRLTLPPSNRRCGFPASGSPENSRLRLAGLHVRTGNLHGELLSVHKISQAYPGIPTVREWLPAARAQHHTAGDLAAARFLARRTVSAPAPRAQPAQLVYDSTPNFVPQRRTPLHVPTIDGHGLEDVELHNVAPAEDPGIPRQGGGGALHHQREYRDFLPNGQLERSFAKRQDLPVA